MELPPRARRIPKFTLHILRKLGTTSACAENTGNQFPAVKYQWNYLRVRGEYDLWGWCGLAPGELPPRARRIQPGGWVFDILLGTTSACAENTLRHGLGAVNPRNYLRVRGEYELDSTREQLDQELPPRARRIQTNRIMIRPNRGTTSACAENTGERLDATKIRWNYLRVRGEYTFAGAVHIDDLELPPRAQRILKGTARK